MRLSAGILILLFTILWYITPTSVSGQTDNQHDSISRSVRIENILDSHNLKYTIQDTIPKYQYTIFQSSFPDTIVFADSAILRLHTDSLIKLPISRTDYLMYRSNSLVLPLIYTGRDIHEVWNGDLHFRELLYPVNKSLFVIDTTQNMSAENQVADLRNKTRTYIANNAMDLYSNTLDRLPSLTTFMSRPISRKRLEKLEIHDDKIVLNSTKIEYEKVKPVYWQSRANMMLQFTQNYVSQNWYQGGNSNLAFLNNFIAEFNYDNRKNMQWTNKIEWRSGLNTVDGDTLRKMSVNDDLLRYLTKFGVKASGNFYYSISGEISTTLFNNYKGINSMDLKAKLLTPVRANLGIGLDYKYKKLFSLMLAPVSFKYIYLNDTTNINPNAFGIEKGHKQLKQLGSSLEAQLNYDPMLNWNITSRFKFYTDYKKIEADWEIVNNFSINRFLSARFLLNPRYDNTVILKGGEKAQIQFKELLSVGFSYRFF
ncbi:MAG: DUF3078 domain-containing protein [Paludibacteraceae bacterium]